MCYFQKDVLELDSRDIFDAETSASMGFNF